MVAPACNTYPGCTGERCKLEGCINATAIPHPFLNVTIWKSSILSIQIASSQHLHIKQKSYDCFHSVGTANMQTYTPRTTCSLCGFSCNMSALIGRQYLPSVGSVRTAKSPKLADRAISGASQPYEPPVSFYFALQT